MSTITMTIASLPSIANRVIRRLPFQKYFLLFPFLIALIYLFWPTGSLSPKDNLSSPQHDLHEKEFDLIPLQKLIIEADNSSQLSCFGEDAVRIKKSLEKSEEVYQSHVKKRRALVKKRPQKINPWKLNMYPFDYFLPTFVCPFSTERMGRLGDGGKWVCGMEILEQKPSCVIYSFGIARETSFEQEMLKRTRCELYAYDRSVNKVVGIPGAYQNRLHFCKLFGGSQVSEEYITIGEAMRRNGHKKIDLLKMDVEGAELGILTQVIEEFGDELPFTQLLLEIHADSEGFVKLYAFFDMLERAGLRPFMNELNIEGFVKGLKHSQIAEYSFLYVKRLC